MYQIFPFDQAASVLPTGLQQVVRRLPNKEKTAVEEFRLRVGRPLYVTLPEGEHVVPDSPIITAEDLRSMLEIATQASIHMVLERVRNGFITVQGGHRIGLCGSAVMKNGMVHILNNLSSANIRIARQVCGIADSIIRQMLGGGSAKSVLVVAPPGAGKTTLLRDMIRGLSNGVDGRTMRIGVVDERGELAAMYQGVPQMDLGPHTDIMDACSKAEGLMMLLRAMNPQVLAVDEITDPGDIDAIETACGCGVAVLATVHGGNLNDLKRRPLYAALLEQGIFQKALLIEHNHGVRQYRWEELPC